MHVIGVSSQAAGHKTLVPQLIAALKAQQGEDILVVGGGVIPAQDYDMLSKAGSRPSSARVPIFLRRRRKSWV